MTFGVLLFVAAAGWFASLKLSFSLRCSVFRSSSFPKKGKLQQIGICIIKQQASAGSCDFETLAPWLPLFSLFDFGKDSRTGTSASCGCNAFYMQV